MRVLKFPDEWLAPSEPSPQDKELTRLRARVRELETAEPDLKAVLTFGVAAPFTKQLVEALTDDERRDLKSHLVRKTHEKFKIHPALPHSHWDMTIAMTTITTPLPN